MSLGTYHTEHGLFVEEQQPVVIKRSAYLFSATTQFRSSSVPFLVRRARKPLPPEYVPEPGAYGKSRMPPQLMSAAGATPDTPRHFVWPTRGTLPDEPEPGQRKRVVIQFLNYYRPVQHPALARRKQPPPTEPPGTGDRRAVIAHFTNLRHILPPIHARMHPRTRHTPEHEPEPGDYRKPDPQLHQHHPDTFGALISRMRRESPEYTPEPGDRRVLQFHFQHLTHLHSESYLKRRPTPDSLFPDPEPGDYRVPIISTQTSGGTLTAILAAILRKRALPDEQIDEVIDLVMNRRRLVLLPPFWTPTPDAINAICIGQITVVPAISIGKVTVVPAIDLGQITIVPAISTGKITSEC